MRALASIWVVLLVVAAGCGSTTPKKDSAPARAPAVGEPAGEGHWLKLLLSPDGRTYLGDWSGECEIRTAYFVGAHGGKPRPITNYARGSAESIALGWVEGRARVRLPSGQPPSRRPGVYRVDPQTMKMTLERALPWRPGC